MSSVLDEVLDGFEPSLQFVSVMAASRSASILSIDIGTSGVRAALFDDAGNQLEDAVTRLQRSALDDVTSLDADDGVALVAAAIDDVLESTKQVDLISISCFWHSLVGIDSANRATTPVYTWANTQATDAARELRQSFNERELHARTGCRFHPSYWPAKLLWLGHAEPARFSATTRWLSFGEYLVLRLCGETATSVSMASGTGLFNQSLCAWDQEFISALNIQLAQLPEIADSHTTFQGLTNEYALRWPQLANAKVFPAIGDGAANTIGSGCTTQQELALMVGSSGALRVLFRGEPPTELPPELWCYRADKTRIVIGGAVSDAGNLHRWLRESLLPEDDYDSIERSLSLLEADDHGLTVLPFWSGERSPGWSLSARGLIMGLTSNTQPIEILRAAMEAVAYRFALIARALEPFAPDANIVASGNALRGSATWVQILADVLGTPITVAQHNEASTRGAALLALEAAGKIENIETRNSVSGTTFAPNMVRHERYCAAIERQQKCYQQLYNET